LNKWRGAICITHAGGSMPHVSRIESGLAAGYILACSTSFCDGWSGVFMTARAVLAVILMLLMFATAVATIRIGDDGGGQIGAYLAKYRALRASGERVEIDGACASACTMLLGIVPRNRICVTQRASLVFHSAWDAQADQAVAADGNRILWSNYPESVRHWIKRHGGLRDHVITLRGPELAAMFPTCR
jgi:hypothetical protein